MLLCSTCPRVCHENCLTQRQRPRRDTAAPDDWKCPTCHVDGADDLAGERLLLPLTAPDNRHNKITGDGLYKRLNEGKEIPKFRVAILRQLELDSMHEGAAGAVKLAQMAELISQSTKYKMGYGSVQRHRFQEMLNDIVHKDKYTQVEISFENKPSPMVMALVPPFSLRCRECGALERNFHTFCFLCGADFRPSGAVVNQPAAAAAAGAPRPTKKECDAAALRALNTMFDAVKLRKKDDGKIDSNQDYFMDAGGHLLLVHNAAVCVERGPIRDQARKYFKMALETFHDGLPALKERITTESDSESNFSAYKGALCALFILSPNNLLGASTITAKLYCENGGRSEIQDPTSAEAASKRRRVDRAGAAADPFLTAKVTPLLEPATLSLSASLPMLASSPGVCSPMEDHDEAAAAVSSQPPDEEPDVPKILKILYYGLGKVVADDQMFAPLTVLGMGEKDADKVPTTPPSHCGHCGNSSKNRGQRCSECNFPLCRHIDYAALTDWLMMAYIAFVAMKDYNESYYDSFQRTLRLLPLARCYQSPDALGFDFFRHQCYFATHVILLFSDYGQHAVVRSLCTAEWEFVVKYMDFAVDQLEVSWVCPLPVAVRRVVSP